MSTRGELHCVQIMSSQWIRVAPSELASDLSQTTVEIELDSDGTLRLSELRSQFPGATGLRYRNPKTGNLRAVKQFCLNQDSISNRLSVDRQDMDMTKCAVSNVLAERTNIKFRAYRCSS